jgi:hypothetical protein
MVVGCTHHGRVSFPTMWTGRIGHARRVAAVVGVAAIASVFLVGAVRSSRHHPSFAVRHLKGTASLPLSGDLGFAGSAFREGFSAGLDSAPDSLFDWSWTWTDNEGDPVRTHAFVSGSDTGKTWDLLLAGMSTATTGLPACPRACLVLDDGGAHPVDPNRWDLWTPSPVQQNRLLRLLRASPPPWTVVVEATSAWTDPVFPSLADSLPKLQVILHDAENTHWDEAVTQILAQRPKSILFWNTPSEATGLLSRRLAWPVFRSANLWVPEGTSLPPLLHADTLSPLWQVAPGSAAGSWRRWGWRCGKALAQSTRRRILDSIPNWIPALAMQPTDSNLGASSSGWYPGER